VNDQLLDQFVDGAGAYLAWVERGAREVYKPLGEDTEGAWKILSDLTEKIDEFFLLQTAVELDPALPASIELKLAPDAGNVDLDVLAERMRRAPLAALGTGDALPLHRGVNPAYCAKMERFVELVIVPLLGDTVSELSQPQWERVKEAFADYRARRPTARRVLIALLVLLSVVALAVRCRRFLYGAQTVTTTGSSTHSTSVTTRHSIAGPVLATRIVRTRASRVAASVRGSSCTGLSVERVRSVG
jgi:hypothetical protein